jgi:APA family basic amino acid/polyamine antiporter
MIAYTGIETVSNLAEEARDPVRSIPRAISWVAIAVFAIYFTLPWIALSAMPVHEVDGKFVTQLGQDPPHGFKNDPVLGLVENLNLHGAVLSGARVYVGILAATILFIATNAGVIGASRITYAMSSHQQLPEVFRRLHPRLKTPWLALIVFGAIGPTIFLLSGQVDFLGRMYAFGAMLSFTIAHASIIALRVKRGDEGGWRARPNIRIRGISWPVFAVIGGIGTGIAWLVVIQQDPATRYAGLAWLAVGFVFYVLYRRHKGLPLLTTTRAPVPLGPALALEYRSILVPIVAGPESLEAVELAARLATERAGRIVLLRVIVVPLELPLDADLREQLDAANDVLDSARKAAAPYGVRVAERVVRARNAGAAIVEEAERRGAEIIVLGARRGGGRAIFGRTVDYVLKHAPSRVMVAAGRKAVA